MKKEEILAKSRQEKKDEGKEFAFNIGRKSGYIGMLIVFFIVAVFNLYHDLKDTNMALIAVMFGYLGFEGLGLYNITKRKIDFLKFIVGCIVSISFLVLYLNKVSS